MSSPYTTVDDVVDPGLAVGPLAPLLRPARTQLGVELDAPEVACVGAMRPMAIALLAERAAPLLVVVPRTSDADAVADGVAAHLGEQRVEVFPSWETLPHERLSPQPRTVGRRLRVLDRLARPEDQEHPLLVVVAPVRAALQPMDPRLGQRAPLDVAAPGGDATSRGWDGFDGLVEGLAALGYSRTPQVEARGEFAVRGGIVDVFPSAADTAVRIEFFGDDIETMRTFAVGDQRSTGDLDHVRIDPARELVLDAHLRDTARERARVQPRIADALEQLAEGVVFEGAESLVTYLHPRPALLPDFLGDAADGPGPGLVLVDPLLVAQRAAKLHEEAEVLAQVAWMQASDDDAGLAFADLDQLRARAGGRTWELTPFGQLRLPAAPWESLRGDVGRLGERVRRLLADGRRVVLTTAATGPARRLADVLGEQTVPAVVHEHGLPTDPGGARAEIVVSPLREGVDAPELGLAVLGEFDVFGPRRRRRASRRMGTRTAAADAVLDLSPGDPVVHRAHGVGRFVGMVTREIRTPSGDTARRDYVELEYADGDRLFVPSDQVDAVARYRGGEDPRVMRLGGAQWERAKDRVRSNVREIAGELIRLYAARMHSPGHAFEDDGAMQRELEDSFAHVETADQLTSAEEIKHDMQDAVPMDRLLVGDVGFGKTEVAVRAAAKAVFGGKQVAVLVPTTILAQQHHDTFRERFAGFPVEIRQLSRFVSGSARRAVLDGLAAGTVDIVIGTHALLASTVQWKDLGLVVVDEEQRFGVRHKERLKQLRTSVDVLSMSATPIPRTLEMAVTGIRDLSTIETAPEDRQPVLTFVQEFDEDQVALAIRRELLRDGQVFYLHNQVDTIDRVVGRLRELVPDARVAGAHGQMNERTLEQAMLSFWEREIDVLVCTTIVESGLDIPNANTLIVERADLLGLSQLHQLRGRVGRSSDRGYAYFLHPPDASLTETAYQRLETVADHARLGSGLQIALRDLEIRGAGNVVGAEQSGQVAAVGFDMYAQLLSEEVAEMRGEQVEEVVEVRLDLPVDAHLPHEYVQDARQRLELYRRIAAVRDAAGVRAVRAELQDRFGRLPAPADRLVTLAALKAALRRWGVTDVSVTHRDRLRVRPVELADSQQIRLQRIDRGATYDPGARTVELPLPDAAQGELVSWVASTLRTVLAPPKGP